MPTANGIYYQLNGESNEGQKPPVVLVHGAGGTHLYWPTEIRRLPGYRVYALDLPGHGKSGGRGYQSIPAYAQAVLEWLAAVGLYRAVFIGHSMGSAIVMTLALNHSEHVVGLGLIGGGARLQVAPELLESIPNPTTFYSVVEKIVNWSFGEKTPAKLTELAMRRMGEIRPSVLHGDFLACNAFDEMERIAQINKPTLIMCGGDDKMTPVRYAQYLATKIPGAGLKVIPDTGHMLMLEQPRAVASMLMDFLTGISH